MAGPSGTAIAPWRSVAGLALVSGVFGVTFGLAADEAGVPWAQATALSLLVFGGSSQFATVAILGAGGSVGSIVAVSALLGARFAPLSLAVAARLRVSGWRRLAGTVVLSDPSGVTVLADEGPTVRQAYWTMGIATLGAWTLGTAAGSLLADHAAFDPRRLGLDVALPALLLAMIAGAVKDRSAATHLVAGGVLALCLTSSVPPGVDVLVGGLATVGLLALLPGAGRRVASWVRR